MSSLIEAVCGGDGSEPVDLGAATIAKKRAIMLGKSVLCLSFPKSLLFPRLYAIRSYFTGKDDAFRSF